MNKKNICLLVIAVLLYLAFIYFAIFMRHNILLEARYNDQLTITRDKQVINAIMDKKIELNENK